MRVLLSVSFILVAVIKLFILSALIENWGIENQKEIIGENI